MKKLFLSLVALVCAMVSFAQNTLVATLTHGDEINMYYGMGAYQQAMNAATDGDVINLSGGKFYSVAVTKAVTVRGTGVLEENPTIIDGRFDVNVPASDTHRLTMEGITTNNGMTITGSTSNPYFLKCDFYSIYVYENAQRVMVVSCNIRDALRTYANTSSQFISSYVNLSSTDNGASTEFINCVIRMSSNYPESVYNSNIINSIIVNKSSGSFYSFPVSTVLVNCISVGSGNPFRNNTGTNNISGLDMSIFVDSNILNDLTDDATAKYLGYDETPVGMYGGIMPRNMIPSYPRITKMNVAKQTTTDGKLSVEIEVSAAE